MDVLYPAPGMPDGVEGFTIIHASDFSGDVTIRLYASRVSQPPAAPDTVREVSIPFEVLAQVVAEAARQQGIRALESAPYHEILGLYPKGDDEVEIHH